MGNLHNRVAIISGAGSGLGRAASISFAAAGAEVVLLGRRLSKLEETAALVKAKSQKEALILQTDVAEEQQVQDTVAAVIEHFGRIDILLNNAAVFESGTVLELTSEEWQNQIATNLTGPFLLTKAVLPAMRKAKYGRIINITSGLSWSGAGGYAAYSAAKAGLESLTRTLAGEEHEHGILANLYNPGTLRSEMHATGKDPAVVTPDLIRLASLPAGGPTGTIVSYG
ncbi:3-oxoacyl-[acyl-carrier protein] reductase [Paenibacillus endophyticus]|uniref:3-oxoacyl-[acyl-carrier protein] reductase n=1 Tax=Paenibacillus endophyticus TaxID=1294268 RepID=A0A7W5G7W0_9BACL|nr:SDR family oxidoreductase [Paenibacillus endophyticus]MBB3149981.1 3-oxoacyl-[acyl-carrier protein] reductase [Paenibacillus endophyticus]